MRILCIILVTLISISDVFSQVLSNNGAAVSIVSGTVISTGNLENTTGAIVNGGSIILSSNFNNAGTVSGSGFYSVAGNWTNTGTYTSGTETVTLNGNGVQTLTGAAAFGNLILNNSTGFSLNTNLTINGGLTLTNGAINIGSYNLTINGSVSGSGTLSGSSASSLILGGAAGTINLTPGFRTLKNLTLTNNASAILGTPLDIVGGSASGTVAVNSGASLAANGNLTLRSNATGTARIGNSQGAITGNVTVERYIAGRRKYRIITSSVTTSSNATLNTGEESLSIWGNWQNNGNNVAGLGNIITGGAGGDGFDQQTTTASMYTYDEANRNFVGFTSANGKNTKYTPLKAGVPYYMFVYGDRTNSIITATPGNTTIKSTGTLLVGDQTYNTSSSLPLSNVVGRYTMVGNPFASPIDWGSVVKTNIASTYWGWDPNLSSTGGYVTVTTTGTATLISPYSGSTGLNQYIQPGQGFFVQTTAASPIMVIREQDKVANFNANAFRTRQANDVPLIAVNLLYDNGSGNTLADGVLAAFDTSFSNNVGKEDAVKMSNTSESISILNQNQFLSIDARQFPQVKDTMFLNVSKLTKPKYALQIFTSQLNNNGIAPYLEDTYLNTSVALSLTDTNRVDFSIDLSKAPSFAANRFKIVYKQGVIEPISYIKVEAALKNKDAQIQWSVLEDNTVQKYSVEYSVDNRNFSMKAEVKANGKGNRELYDWTDVNVSSKNNYYRIRSHHSDGKNVVSKTVHVQVEMPAATIKVFPNPVINQVINLQIINLEKGQYKLALLNTYGSEVFNKMMIHEGSSTNLPLLLPIKLPAGTYYLRISNGISNYSQPILIQ